MEAEYKMIIEISNTPSDEKLKEMASCSCTGCNIEKSALDLIYNISGMKEPDSPLKAYYNLIRYMTAKGYTAQQVITLGLMAIVSFSKEPPEKTLEDIKQLQNHESAAGILTKVSILAAADMGVMLIRDDDNLVGEPKEVM